MRDWASPTRGWSGEPPRESRRLHSLSLWEERADEITDKILSGSPGTGGAPGVGRLVLDHQGEHDSQWSAITSVASKLGCTAQTLRKWVRQAERDRGGRAGLSSEERRRLKELERENRELRRANESLRKASAYLSTFGRQHHHHSPRRSSTAARGGAATRPVAGASRRVAERGRSAGCTSSTSRCTGYARSGAGFAARGWRWRVARLPPESHRGVASADAPDGAARGGAGPAGEDHARADAQRAPR